MFRQLIEPIRALFSRVPRLRTSEAVRRTLRESTSPAWAEEDPDRDDWKLALQVGKEADDGDRDTLRSKARDLADKNPYARNILALYRDYVVGTGMRHEVRSQESEVRTPDSRLLTPARLWSDFLQANDWHSGNRKDWEFCTRTWRDGECFLRLFRTASWPPRVHFIDPEDVAADPQTGLPTAGIETAVGNVEQPVAYFVRSEPEASATVSRGSVAYASGSDNPIQRIPADRILHTKIGVDGNVKRGQSIFVPVMEALKRYQSWLDVELIHRKFTSSIVMVRKHESNSPTGIKKFGDENAEKSGAPQPPAGSTLPRPNRFYPGSIIDALGFDVKFLSPDTKFSDASLPGRSILLSIAAATGLPEFMLTADSSNANYASTLVAEGPAVKHFASWQTFFIGQWRTLFRMVMADAVAMGLLERNEVRSLDLQITPPTLAVRDRHQDAQADAVYFDRGAISAQELARRDGVDPELMRKERGS